MSDAAKHTDLCTRTQQLLQGPLKHIAGAALAATLVPLATVAATSATQQNLCASGGVCGVVYNDTNNNGVLDAGETGIGNATVKVCQLCDSSDDLYGVTDANGFYSIFVPGGTTTITVTTPVGVQTATAPADGTFTNFGFFTPSNNTSCPAGSTTTNSTLLNNLGAAGPGNFTVLSLGGAGAVININLATVDGNVGMPSPGTLKESAPSVVNGNLVIGSTVNTRGVVGRHGAIVVNDALLAQAVQDANAAEAFFAGLPVTPAVQAQFPANGQITGNLTVTGTPGLNVVNLSNFLLNNGSGTLTLTGPAGTAFVINDSGNFNLHSGNIKVAGGVGPLDVVYNITNPKATVTTMVPTTAIGILLAPDNTINAMDSATFTGEVIGGFEKTIVLLSGTHVTNPCAGAGSPE